MKREDVYRLVDGERDYQDSRWGSTLSSDREPVPGTQGGDRTIDEFALYIAGYSDDLIREASHFGGAENKLAIVRKLAGLCVACMEQHGAPQR